MHATKMILGIASTRGMRRRVGSAPAVPLDSAATESAHELACEKDL